MYLGFDLGTTNVKAVVVDDDGWIAATGASPVQRDCTPDGGVQQDIEQIWQATRAAIRQAVAAIAPAVVRSVGVSSQGAAVQVLGPQDAPLGRVISWLDARGRPFDEEIIAQYGREFLAAHIGHGGSLMTIGQVLRLRREAPHLLDPPNRLGFVGDVTVGRLCGRRAHDATSLGIAMLYNPWQDRADAEMLGRLGLAESQLPDLVSPTKPAGGLRPEVAADLGLRPGIPVSPAIHDQYAASLGAGAVAEGDINFGAGTAWALLANTARLSPPVIHQAFVCRHPVPGLYGQMLSMVNGGSAVEWVKGLLGGDDGASGGLDAMMAAVAPGCDGLRFWPLLLPGIAAGTKIKPGGRLEGITLAHGPQHLARAVVEGLACELARHLRFLTDAGVPARRFSMCGPAAASRITPQIIADVTGLPVACVETPDVSALGAAMIARALVEDAADLAGIARRWAPASRTVPPGPDAALYRRLLEEYLVPFA